MTPSDPSSLDSPLPRILLIDDDAISREVLAMMLEIHGFAVSAAEGGAEALALIAQSETGALPELILMDTQMPGISGLDLVTALRQSSSAKIVAISGSEVTQNLIRATDSFLLKPIEPASLIALLESRTATVEAASPPGADELIDPAVLAKLKAMMPQSAVAEIYTAVTADLERRLADLEAAMHANNASEVRRIAHAIKGGCSMVGLKSAAEAASQLEMSNGSATWQKELLHLALALRMLQSIAGNGLPW